MAIEQIPLPEEVRVGDEREILVAMLDYYRAVLRRKTAGLDSEELAVSIAPSDLTLGGLLKHMALVEHSWFVNRLAGQPEGEPWASVDWAADRDWDFHSASNDTPDALVALYDNAIADSRRVLAGHPDLDQVVSVDSRIAAKSIVFNLRWLLVHMIEEYARHCGHADLIRQTIDGAIDD